MKWGRPTLPVGAGAAHETEAIETSGAVAERATGNVGKEALELSLGYGPLLGDDPQELEVEVRERGQFTRGTAPARLPYHLAHQTDPVQG